MNIIMDMVITMDTIMEDTIMDIIMEDTTMDMETTAMAITMAIITVTTAITTAMVEDDLLDSEAPMRMEPRTLYRTNHFIKVQ